MWVVESAGSERRGNGTSDSGSLIAQWRGGGLKREGNSGERQGRVVWMGERREERAEKGERDRPRLLAASSSLGQRREET